MPDTSPVPRDDQYSDDRVTAESIAAAFPDTSAEFRLAQIQSGATLVEVAHTIARIAKRESASCQAATASQGSQPVNGKPGQYAGSDSFQIAPENHDFHAEVRQLQESDGMSRREAMASVVSRYGPPARSAFTLGELPTISR